MSNKSNTSLAVALTWITLAVVVFYGWCMNIYQLVSAHDAGLTVKFVLKIIGIFVVPLGGLMGFIN